MLKMLAAVYSFMRDIKDCLREERGSGYVDYAWIAAASVLVGGTIFTLAVPAVRTYIQDQVLSPLSNLR